MPLSIGLSCSTPSNLPYDPVYDTRVPAPKKKNENLEERTFDFRHHSSFHWDFDFDGIYDWADPWPYNYGPFIDMNDNGIVDFMDMRISFYNPFWQDYYAHNHFHWNHSWHHHWHHNWSNFYWDYYFPKETKPIYYGPRKGNTGSTIPKREIRPKKNVDPVNPPGERSRKVKPKEYTPLNKKPKYEKPRQEKPKQRYPLQNQKRETPTKKYYSPRKNNTNPNTYYSPRKNSTSPKKQYTPRRTPTRKSPTKQYTPQRQSPKKQYTPTKQPTQKRSTSPKKR